MSNALLHIGSEIDTTVEDDFNRWCEGHVRANLELPGFVRARRFRKSDGWAGAGQSPRYLTIYDLDDVGALESDAYAAHDHSVPDAFAVRLSFERSVYREIGVHGRDTGPAILHVTVDVDPDRIEPFLKWYVNEHVPAVLDAPGMLGARRYARAGEAQHDYCTLYEMEDPGVVARPETQEASLRGACPPELEPHRVAFNHVYEEIFRA